MKKEPETSLSCRKRGKDTLNERTGTDSTGSGLDESVAPGCGERFPESRPSGSAAGRNMDIPIDWSVISRYFEDKDTLMQVVRIFTEDSPQTIRDLAAAIQAQRSQDIQLHAHSLKGVSALIGAEQLRQRAWQLECAGAERNTAAFEVLFDETKEEFDKLMSFLSRADWVETAKEHHCSRQQAEQA